MSSAKKQPLVSIVILNWNGLEDTKLCLESVYKSDYQNYEVIVVDNGSHPESKQYLSQLTKIIYIDNAKNRGFTGGHIDGLEHCSGDYVVLLNNDAVIQADYLTRAVAHFKDPAVAAVGGRSYAWNENTMPFDATGPFYSYMTIDVFTGEAHLATEDDGVVQAVNAVSGSAIMVRMESIRAIGYLYDRFFAYFEETDLFARMKRAGMKVLYDPELHIWHRNGASSGASSGSNFFYYHIFRNRFIFAVRNFEPWFLRRFLVYYFKLGLTSFIRVVLGRDNRIMNKAYAKAAAYNLFTLPQAFFSRFRLHRHLGRSYYNHMIYAEQSRLSVVVDAADMSIPQLQRFAADLTAVRAGLDEYLIVIEHPEAGQKLPALPASARYVIDRGYFEASSLNLGWLTARHDWVAFMQASDLRSTAPAHEAITRSLGTTKTFLAAKQQDSNGSDPIITNVVHKSLLQKMGGLRSRGAFNEVLASVAAYASKTHVLQDPAGQYGDASEAEVSKLDDKIRYDTYLLRSQKAGRFDGIIRKHYRLYQLVTFGHWLIMRRVPLRLKLARLRNLLIHTIRFRVQSLALEFKHIRNEVLVYGGDHKMMEWQKNTISHSLKKSKQATGDLPVFIICRDRIEPLRELVAWLEGKGIKKIVFIDNDSAYKPLLDFYTETPYQVLRLNRNVGHTSPWTLGIIRTLVPEDFYIVTDPDVIPAEDCPDDVISYFLTVHQRFMAYKKVGFSLKIDDLPDHYPLKKSVVEWEGQFFKHPLDNGLYEAGLDTTFACYKPFTYAYSLHPSIRTGAPYEARHLPWYVDPAKISDEEVFYRFRVNTQVTSWNTDILAERYAKEMAKN